MYEVAQAKVGTMGMAQAVPRNIRPDAESPQVLKALAEAASAYSSAASDFITARNLLEDARAHFNSLSDQATKLLAQENV